MKLKNKKPPIFIWFQGLIFMLPILICPIINSLFISICIKNTGGEQISNMIMETLFNNLPLILIFFILMSILSSFIYRSILSILINTENYKNKLKNIINKNIVLYIIFNLLIFSLFSFVVIQFNLFIVEESISVIYTKVLPTIISSLIVTTNYICFELKVIKKLI